jgi:hypothetical protein
MGRRNVVYPLGMAVCLMMGMAEAFVTAPGAPMMRRCVCPRRRWTSVSFAAWVAVLTVFLVSSSCPGILGSAQGDIARARLSVRDAHLASRVLPSATGRAMRAHAAGALRMHWGQAVDGTVLIAGVDRASSAVAVRVRVCDRAPRASTLRGMPRPVRRAYVARLPSADAQLRRLLLRGRALVRGGCGAAPVPELWRQGACAVHARLVIQGLGLVRASTLMGWFGQVTTQKNKNKTINRSGWASTSRQAPKTRTGRRARS